MRGDCYFNPATQLTTMVMGMMDGVDWSCASVSMRNVPSRVTSY